MAKFRHTIMLQFAFIAAVFFSMFSLAATADDTTDKQQISLDKKIVIRVEAVLIPPRVAYNLADRAQRRIVETFMEKNPDIEVVQATGLSLRNTATSLSQLMMSIAGGTPPTVITASYKNARTLTAERFMLPLDKFVDAESQEFRDSFHKTVWPVIKHNTPYDPEKHVYFIPRTAPNVICLEYRKDLFAQCGLDPEKPPTTWEEFHEYAKKMTNRKKGTFGFGTYFGGGASWNYVNFIFQAGGRAVEEQPDGSWKAIYNNDAGVTALRFYHKLCKEKFTSINEDGTEVEEEGVVFQGAGGDVMTRFMRGQIGMVMESLGGEMAIPNRAQEDPDQIGFAPLPVGPTGRPDTMLNCGLVGICSLTEDPKVQEAAWKFIRFLASDEAQRIRTEMFVKSGFGNYVNPLYLKKFGYNEIAKIVNPAFVKIQEQSIKYGVPEPYGPQCDFIYNEIAQALDIAMGTPLYNEDGTEALDYKATLDHAVDHTNVKLLGLVPEDVMQFRRWIVYGVLAVCFGIMLFAMTRIFRIFSAAADKSIAEANAKRPGQRMSKFKRNVIAWAFMSLAVLSVTTWAYYPVGKGLLMAFQDYHLLLDRPFIGVDNFVTVFWQDTFWIAVWNTIFYVFLSLSLGFFAPIFLAILLDEIPIGSLFFRVVFYVPTITSPLIIMMLWTQFYDESQIGFFNQIIDNVINKLPWVEIGPQSWLRDPKLAMICVIIPGIWGGIGAGSILYLAALKNVPLELYEAASIDGANIWQRIIHITFPTLRILLIITFLGAFIGAFHATERILVMTGGGPMNATHVIGLEVFYNAFVYLKYGYATAVAWILGSCLIAFTIYQLKILRNVTFSTASRD